MRIGFLLRKDLQKWGGDLTVLYALGEGLKACGHQALFATTPFDLLKSDLLFLTNSCFDLRSSVELLKATATPYGVIPFHEDYLHYQPLASGFYSLIAAHFGLTPFDKRFPTSLDATGYLPSIEHLAARPEMAAYFSQPPRPFALYNQEILASASLCVASSLKEASTIQRDSPKAKVATIKWAFSGKGRSEPNDAFLKWTGLSSKSYLLHVGRLQARKNALGAILASRNFDIPLVLICGESFEKIYEQTCIEAACKWRKAPTLFISQTLPSLERGAVRIIPMPDGKKLPEELLYSAYHHASLYLHPAFQELPGLTLIEAASFGLPIVASTGCSIDEYFYEESTGRSDLGGQVCYPSPSDLHAIEEGIKQLFGQRFAPLETHPAITRTPTDVAHEFLQEISNLESHYYSSP